MSTIGKIFLFLNFGLAFGFLFWASTELGKGKKLSELYAKEQADRKAEVAALTGEKTNLTNSLNGETRQKDEFRSQRDTATSESNRNKEDLDAQKRANEGLRADIAKIQETLGDYNKTIQAMQTAKDAAIAEARQAERDRDAATAKSTEAETAKRNAEEALQTANLNIAELERNLKSTKDQVAKLDTEVSTMVATYNIPRSGTPLKDIKATVVQVDYSLKPGLVALNVGSNAGVSKGYTFEIYNGNTYKGQVRVEQVHPDMCSALITFAKETIGAGDSASTHL